MSVYVEKYVSGCDKCQRTKNRNQPTHGLLQPNSVPTAPWQIISCDLITQLPKSSGYDAIFVVVDRLTKQAHFIPTTSNVDSPGIANLFVAYVWKLHGTPREVISDRGPQFASKFCGIPSSNLVSGMRFQLPIIHKLMVRQKGLTKNWNSTYEPSSTSDNPTGHHFFPWRNLPTTLGLMLRPRHHPSNSSTGMSLSSQCGRPQTGVFQQQMGD